MGCVCLFVTVMLEFETRFWTNKKGNIIKKENLGKREGIE
jgi:hypothetical protein